MLINNNSTYKCPGCGTESPATDPATDRMAGCPQCGTPIMFLCPQCGATTESLVEHIPACCSACEKGDRNV